jgi:hypothetical protein
MTTTPNTDPMPPATSANIFPTDQEINRLAAELIGYRWYRMPAWASRTRILKTLYRPEDIAEWPEVGRYLLADGTEETYENDTLPDFCSPDCPHSLTAQLLAVVEAADRHQEMWQEMVWLIGGGKISNWKIFSVTPKQKTIAVLRALNAWPGAWQIPTQ